MRRVMMIALCATLVQCRTMAAVPPVGCVAFDGTVINATETSPYVILDFLSCYKCFCPDNDYDDGLDYDYNYAVCLIVDCVTPRCVDPLQKDGECCPRCPNGENCYLGRGRKRGNLRTVIPAGQAVMTGRGKGCRCDDQQLGPGERYNDVALCNDTVSKLAERRAELPSP